DPSRPHPDWKRKEGLYATFERPIEADEVANLKQIPRKQRAVVRKALKSELTFSIDTEVADFFNLFALSVRNLGTPVFARKYFEELVRVFGDDCDILTVRLNGRPVSSVLNFYFRDRVMPYYTGSNPEARKIGANDFMYWCLMRHAVARGHDIFDFGRSKLGTGPYSFKTNWGFEPRPVIHEFRMRDGIPMPDVNPNNPKYRLMISVWKKLPLPVANFIGPYIGRQVG
ncbi:MAG: FemAB family PEP-CTERM system-associated protein, partial [Rhodospirillales bacterium]|nr:FemAB family PEP-CTERM system-associated protein [Rhodospirillales bacterium]